MLDTIPEAFLLKAKGSSDPVGILSNKNMPQVVSILSAIDKTAPVSDSGRISSANRGR
jgi:hypothetical protein